MERSTQPIAVFGVNPTLTRDACEVLQQRGFHPVEIRHPWRPQDSVAVVTQHTCRVPIALITVVSADDLQRLSKAPAAMFQCIESCDVVILVGEAHAEGLAALRRLQPRATIVSLDQLHLGTPFKRFDAQVTPYSSGIYQALLLGAERELTTGLSEVIACDTYKFAYRARVAFEPSQWEQIVWPQEVMRAFGCVTIGDEAFVLDQLGGNQPSLVNEGDAPGGSHLAFLGAKLNTYALKEMLDAALCKPASSLRLLATRRLQRYGASET